MRVNSVKVGAQGIPFYTLLADDLGLAQRIRENTDLNKQIKHELERPNTNPQRGELTEEELRAFGIIVS
jgi:hypothetical protein